MSDLSGSLSELETDPGTDAGDNGDAMLEVLAEFRELYQQRLERLHRDPSAPSFHQERARLLEDWVDELGRQNTTLVQTVRQLESEASRRCAMLEGRLVTTTSSTKQQMLQLRQLQQQVQQVMAGRLEAEARAADMTSVVQRLTEQNLQLRRGRELGGRPPPQGEGRAPSPPDKEQVRVPPSPRRLVLPCRTPSPDVHRRCPAPVQTPPPPSRGEADGDVSAHVHRLQADLRLALREQRDLSEILEIRNCELEESHQEVGQLRAELERLRQRPSPSPGNSHTSTVATTTASEAADKDSGPAAVHRLQLRCRHLQQQRNRALAELARLKVLRMEPDPRDGDAPPSPEVASSRPQLDTAQEVVDPAQGSVTSDSDVTPDCSDVTPESGNVTSASVQQQEPPSAEPVTSQPELATIKRQPSVRADVRDQDEREARNQLVSELQRHLSSARDEVALRDTAISRLEQKLTASRAEVAALTEQVGRGQVERAALTEANQALSEQVEAFGRHLTDATTARSQLEAAADTRLSEIAQLQHSLAETETRATELAERCAHRDVEIGRQWTTISSLQEALLEAKGQLAAVQPGRSSFLGSLLGGGGGADQPKVSGRYVAARHGADCDDGADREESGKGSGSVSADESGSVAPVEAMFEPLQTDLRQLADVLTQQPRGPEQRRPTEGYTAQYWETEDHSELKWKTEDHSELQWKPGDPSEQQWKTEDHSEQKWKTEDHNEQQRKTEDFIVRSQQTRDKSLQKEQTEVHSVQSISTEGHGRQQQMRVRLTGGQHDQSPPSSDGDSDQQRLKPGLVDHRDVAVDMEHQPTHTSRQSDGQHEQGSISGAASSGQHQQGRLRRLRTQLKRARREADQRAAAAARLAEARDQLDTLILEKQHQQYMIRELQSALAEPEPAIVTDAPPATVDTQLTTDNQLTADYQPTLNNQLLMSNSQSTRETQPTSCAQLTTSVQLSADTQLVDQLSDQLAEQRSICDHVTSQLAGERCHVQSLTEQLEELQAEHACCAELRETLETRQAQAADNQARLDSQLSDAYQQLADTRQQLSDTRQQLSDTQQQLSETRAQLAETLCGQEEVHSQADVIVSHVAGWLAEWRVENQRLQTTARRQADTIAALRADNRMLAGRLDSLAWSASATGGPSSAQHWDRYRAGVSTETASLTARCSGPFSDTRPGSFSDTRPGSFTEGRPGSLTEGRPGSLTEGRPGSLTEGRPGSLTEGRPGSLTEGRPGSFSEVGGSAFGEGRRPGPALTTDMLDTVQETPDRGGDSLEPGPAPEQQRQQSAQELQSTGSRRGGQDWPSHHPVYQDARGRNLAADLDNMVADMHHRRAPSLRFANIEAGNTG